MPAVVETLEGVPVGQDPGKPGCLEHVVAQGPAGAFEHGPQFPPGGAGLLAPDKDFDEIGERIGIVAPPAGEEMDIDVIAVTVYPEPFRPSVLPPAAGAADAFAGERAGQFPPIVHG